MACTRIKSDINPREVSKYLRKADIEIDGVEVNIKDAFIVDADYKNDEHETENNKKVNIYSYLENISYIVADIIDKFLKAKSEYESLRKKNNDFRKHYIVPIFGLIQMHRDEIEKLNNPVFSTHEIYDYSKYIDYIKTLEVNQQHDYVRELIKSIYEMQLIPICKTIYTFLQTDNNFANKINRLDRFDILN